MKELTTIELETSKSIIYDGHYALGEIQLKHKYKVFSTCTPLLKIKGDYRINLLCETHLN